MASEHVVIRASQKINIGFLLQFCFSRAVRIQRVFILERSDFYQKALVSKVKKTIA